MTDLPGASGSSGPRRPDGGSADRTGSGSRPPWHRRIGAWWISIAIVATLALLAAVTPSPYAIERPGPVVDAFGTIATDDGDVEVVRIEGTRVYETSGSLNVLSVYLTGTPDQPNSWMSLFGTMFDRTSAIVPLSDLYPEGSTVEERTRENDQLMRSSQETAAAAALRKVGEPVESRIRVAEVAADGPAKGVLQADDVIRAVDGAEISDAAGLRAAVARVPDGATARLTIARSGAERTESVVPERTDGGSQLLGVTVSEEFSFPFDVQFDLDTIGGPSAGLIFALAVYDRLTPGELTGGLDVSGTGTIDEEGAVGPIGGLQQKIWGASQAGSTLMLMPLDNCRSLPTDLPDGMRIAPVATLDEAVAAIGTVADGGTPPGIERCGRR